ncbi:MAG: hypothetical protein ACYTGN_04675 [Planctomycetota bacterium]|jgi:HSP20 family molecular chaperone IbpA
MTTPGRDEVEQEMARARRRYAWLLMEVADAHEAPCTWELMEEALCWHVVLRDAVEPDVDVEILDQALVVRATVADRLRHALLPVPAPFDAAHARIRFQAGVLEVRLYQQRGGGRAG